MTLLEFMNLFAEFRAASWDAWRGVLARITAVTRSLIMIIGRGGGKSRICAFLACYFGTSRDYPRVPGEKIYVGVFAPDRKQARVTFGYIGGMLRSVAALGAMIVRESADSIELSNGVVIEVITASLAAPRGRSYACAIVEEAAFLPTDQSANPDVELIRAIRPALARVPGSLLCIVSSPYARRGVLFDAWQKFASQPDGRVVLVQAPTLALNPTFDAAAIEQAFAEDPESASAEYGAQFRSDVEGFIDRAAIDAVVVPGRRELPPVRGLRYAAMLDFAAGVQGGDSAALAIAHADTRDGRTVIVLDLVREWRPKFSPADVCREAAATLQAYGATAATADRWAGSFPAEAMAAHRVTVTPSARSKSEIYLDLLPLLNSGGIELLDHGRLISQLATLERRMARGGRDAVDHGPGAHDDLINAAAGAICLCAGTRTRRYTSVTWA